MRNIEIEEAVGDNKNPPLKPHGDALRGSVDGAANLPGQGAAPLEAMSQAASVAQASRAQASTPADCLQKLWFSFFFDGTGNNMYADEGTLKHSNVAKLYHVHNPDSRVNGIYRLYIPGVGTPPDGGRKCGGNRRDTGASAVLRVWANVWREFLSLDAPWPEVLAQVRAEIPFSDAIDTMGV